MVVGLIVIGLIVDDGAGVGDNVVGGDELLVMMDSLLLPTCV